MSNGRPRSGGARLLDFIEEATVAVNMVVVFAMMGVVVYGVVMRYLFDSPVSLVTELTGFMMVSLTFLSLSYVYRIRHHVAVSFFLARGSRRTQWLFGLAGTLLCLITFVLMTWGGWKYAYQAWQLSLTSEEASIPLFPPRLLVPLGSALICLRLLADLVRGIRDKALLGPSEDIALDDER